MWWEDKLGHLCLILYAFPCHCPFNKLILLVEMSKARALLKDLEIKVSYCHFLHLKLNNMLKHLTLNKCTVKPIRIFKSGHYISPSLTVYILFIIKLIFLKKKKTNPKQQLSPTLIVTLAINATVVIIAIVYYNVLNYCGYSNCYDACNYCIVTLTIAVTIAIIQ